MAINFPDSPSNGDQYVVAGNTYTWNGVSWDATGSAGSSGSANIANDIDNHLNTSSANTGEVLSWNGSDYDWVADQTGGGGSSGNSLSDGDKGDITVSNSGATWSIDDGVVNAAALAADAVTTDKILNNSVTVGKISATGTPSSSTYLRGDGSWSAVSGGGGSSTFTGLTDTPSSFTADKWLKVNSAGNALEFTDAPSGGGGGSSDPVGTIVAWSGASSTIPSEYQLCDGAAAQTTELQAITGANVPDLRDRFIVGASDTTGDTSYPGLSPGGTGGSADAILVSHSHTINNHTHSFSGSGSDTVSISISGTTGNQSQNHTHNFGANTFGAQSGSSAQLMDNPQSNGGGQKIGSTSGISQDHNHSFSASGSGTASITISGTTGNPSDTGTSAQGSSATNANLPPYYSLCYIVKHTATSSSGSSSSATTSEWSITSNGSSDYRFTGPGFDGTENDPTIYLVRGQQYKFTNNMGAHPFQIRTAINGTAYSDGITNNGVSNGTLTWDIQMDAPNILYYQCTAHAGMVGKIYIGNSLSDGDYVSVKDFGAVGDGVADDTTAIQDAINSGAKHLTFLPGTYKLSGTINITSELHVFAKGAKFIQTVNQQVFDFDVTSLANVYDLGSDYKIYPEVGYDTISLSSTPSSGVIKPGDAIKIVSKAVDRCQRDQGTDSSLYRVGEWATVKSVSGSTITLTMPLKEVKGVDPVSASGEESIINSYDLTYEPKVIVLPRISMSWIGGEVAFEDNHDNDGWKQPVFRCSGYTNPKLSEIVITRGYQSGINLTGTVHAVIKDCSISNLTNNTSQGQYGYGVSNAGTFKTLVEGCTFTNTRHGFTTSSRRYEWSNSTTNSEYLAGGRDQSAIVVNCHGSGGYGGSAPFDTHMCAQDTTFNNCVVDGAESGFHIRGRNVTVSNCKTFNVNNNGIYAFTEYGSTSNSGDAWANDKNHMSSVRINNCELNAFGIPLYMRSLTSCDITDVVANAGSVQVMLVAGCKVNLHGRNTFTVSDFHGTRPIDSSSNEGMITVTGSNSLASYLDPGIFVSPGSNLRLDGTLAASGSTSTNHSVFHFDDGGVSNGVTTYYNHSLVNDGNISIKLGNAIKYIRNYVTNQDGVQEPTCTFSGQGELMWEPTNKHSNFATNFIGFSTTSSRWAYIDAHEMGDASRYHWKNNIPTTTFGSVPETLTFTGTGSKVENAFVIPSQHVRWANQLNGGEVIKQRFNIYHQSNNSATTEYEIRFARGYVHHWSSTSRWQDVEITVLMPSYRTQTCYIRIIDGTQTLGASNVYMAVKDKTIQAGFNSSALEAGAITLDVTSPSGNVIELSLIETTASRFSINVP